MRIVEEPRFVTSKELARILRIPRKREKELNLIVQKTTQERAIKMRSKKTKQRAEYEKVSAEITRLLDKSSLPYESVIDILWKQLKFFYRDREANFPTPKGEKQ